MISGVETLSKFSEKNIYEFKAFEEQFKEKTTVHNIF